MLALRYGYRVGTVGRWVALPPKRTMAKSTEGDAMTIGEYRIAYNVVGTGSHCVLFLPGALGSYKTDFQPQFDAFDRQKFTLIGWDPPGYGRSRPPDRDFGDHFFRRDADVAHKLMQKLGYGESYSLVGWSDGGITALIMAAKYPKFVRRLVAFGVNAYVTKKDIQLYEGISDLSKWSEKMRAPFLAMYGEEYFRKMWTEWLAAYKRFHTDNPAGEICEKASLKQIRCPTLVIHGQQDALVPEEHWRYLNEHIAGCEVIVMPEGKHNLHLRHADKFNAMVQTFLLAKNDHESKL